MKAGFRSAELKFKAHMSQWCKVEAVVSMDMECVLPSTSPDRKEEGRGKGKEEARVDLAQARVGVYTVEHSLQGRDVVV